MKIKDMPFYNQPSVRLKRNGISVLSDAELLSIIFWQGNKGTNAIDLSNKILSKFNFHDMQYLTLEELTTITKDEVKAMKIQAMFEIFNKTTKLEKFGFKPTIECAEDVYYHFTDLAHKKKEHFYSVILDSKNRIIKKDLVSVGTLNASLIHPREVFSEAIKSNANAVIFIHNHPSGDVEPSKEDIEVNKTLVNAGEILGIRVLDHLIITNNGYSQIE